MHLSSAQWITALAAAFCVGVSKTGVPGVGILVVPMLANAFGGRPSIGIMLPMLICGDIFAVFWYRRHAQWDVLVRLVPWVAFGMLVGTLTLKWTGDMSNTEDLLTKGIGVLVIVMLGLHFLRNAFGERLTPKSWIGVAGTGSSAGFATTVSNAAGPIMQMYLAAFKLPKEKFMGTIAWYFFIFNAAKFPIYVVLSILQPKQPIVTLSSLSFNLAVAPVIVVGAFIGKWLLPRLSQKTFEGLILILAFVAALRLVFF